MACAARAEDTVLPGWERCPTASTLPLYRPLDAAPPKREGASTDISAAVSASEWI